MHLRWQIAQFFELHWWRRYLARKEKTTYLDWKRRYWRQFLAQTGIELKPDGKVLDVGCGPAGIFMVLTSQQVDAIDPLLDQYKVKLPHFRAEDYPNTRFFCQKIENFKPGYTYDTLFCLNAVNHVADLPACLDRLSSLTKAGGILVLSVDAHNHSFLKRIFQLFPGDILHPQQYELAEYEAMLEARGFSLESKFLIKREWIFGYWVLEMRRS